MIDSHAQGYAQGFAKSCAQGYAQGFTLACPRDMPKQGYARAHAQGPGLGWDNAWAVRQQQQAMHWEACRTYDEQVGAREM
jgi:hypothetical protein